MASLTDETNPFESVSQASFVVLPRTQKSKAASSTRKSKNTISRRDNIAKDCEGFQRLYAGEEPEDLCRLRYQLYKQHWDTTEHIIDNVLVRLNSEAIEKIKEFVDRAYEHDNDQQTLPFQEVPTGLVFTGINIPDHEKLFAQVARRLSQNSGHAVAVLPSEDCPTLKATIKSLMEQCLGVPQTDINDDQSNIKPPVYDMRILPNWYRHSSDISNIVVIIPDFECFDPQVVQDLVTLCSEYVNDLPIVVLFGIATSIDVMHQTLSPPVLGLLRIEKFKLQHSHECMNTIVEELLVKQPSVSAEHPNTVRLGMEPYEYLINTYQLDTLSIESFTQALKYMTMDFYYSNPLSVLMDLRRTTPHQTIITQLTSEHLIDLRLLKSFKRYVETIAETEPDEAARLLLSDPALKEWLERCLLDFERYHMRYEAAFSCLWELQKAVNSPTFKRPKRTLHLMGLRGDLHDSEYLATLFQLFRKQDARDIKACLRACSQRLHEDGVSERLCDTEYATILELLAELEEFDQTESESSEADEESQCAGSKKRKLAILNAASYGGRNTNVAKRLKPIVENVEEGTVQACVKRIHEFFLNFFRDAFKCYTEMPLHEIIYYTNVGRLKKAFHPQPRAALQTAMGKTLHYLKCSCCRPAAGCSDLISPTQQDITIAYRLYLECGRMINLYDWLIAFGTIIEKETTTGVGPDHAMIQSRFLRAIDELQFLGFIKPTSRKTDHVLRLTWGAV